MELTRLVRNQLDRAIAIGLAVLGLLSIALGWLGVSDSLLPSEQVPYLASGSILGLFLLGVGATIWLSADLRDEWRKLDDVADELRELRTQEERRDAQRADATNGKTPAPPRPRRPARRLQATHDD